MTISFPSNTKATIDAIREAIGRDVTFMTVLSVSGCPDCSLNPVTGTSTDSYCLTCSGEYWIKTYSGAEMMAHITWKPADIVGWYTGGIQFDGDVRLQVEYTNNIEDIIDATEYVSVDGKRMEIKSTILRGVPTINRVLIDLIEQEKEDE